MQLAYRTARKKIRPPFSVLLWAGVGTRLQFFTVLAYDELPLRDRPQGRLS
jgi:hypothetical protein